MVRAKDRWFRIQTRLPFLACFPMQEASRPIKQSHEAKAEAWTALMDHAKKISQEFKEFIDGMNNFRVKMDAEAANVEAAFGHVCTTVHALIARTDHLDSKVHELNSEVHELNLKVSKLQQDAEARFNDDIARDAVLWLRYNVVQKGLGGSKRGAELKAIYKLAKEVNEGLADESDLTSVKLPSFLPQWFTHDHMRSYARINVHGISRAHPFQRDPSLMQTLGADLSDPAKKTAAEDLVPHLSDKEREFVFKVCNLMINDPTAVPPYP